MNTAQTSVRSLTRPDVSAATTDVELAERAASGDELAFECIMRRYNRLLFAPHAAF